MRMKCRIWWPKQFYSSNHPQSTLLFGWCLTSPSSIDFIVTAIVLSPDQINQNLDLQGILRRTNEKLSQTLQERLEFSVLGQCAPECSSNGHVEVVKLRSCGCHSLDGLVEQSRQLFVENGYWIQLSHVSNEKDSKNICWIPKLHHIHSSGQIMRSCDVHVIISEQSTYGLHHVALSSWGSEEAKLSINRPVWVNKLHQIQKPPDLDTVILAINSATAAKVVFENYSATSNSVRQHSIVSLFITITINLTAITVASFFTVVYTILQFFHRFLSYSTHLFVYTIVEKAFSHTFRNIHIRSCQILYWPILLHCRGSRSQSNVEHAHRSALQRHSMWSGVVVDVLVGDIACLALLFHIKTACPWVLNLFHDITNNLLRSGCVWLMGVPAGFKLNTELAEILGMISLNAIQIWSTLWYYLGTVCMHFIKGLALFGIIFGLTVPAALAIDMIILTSLHVSTLHWIISVLYYHQIQALIALWRLFRDRKWNPLRERFDSYNYTVEQHVVGSLLFTPILLLLPTTSVFYIFFTILKSTTSLICMAIELSISIVHATPYMEIFLWMTQPRRFPSGVWFEVKSDQYNSSIFQSMEVECFSKECSSSTSLHEKNVGQVKKERCNVEVSFLRSNLSSLGQIVLPHYRKVFQGVSFSSGISSIHGVLTGKRIPNTLSTGLPPTMPWMSLNYKDYWRLCFTSVRACMHEGSF